MRGPPAEKLCFESSRYLIKNGVVERFRIGSGQVGASAAADEQRVAGESDALFVADVGDAAGCVAGRGARLQPVPAEGAPPAGAAADPWQHAAAAGAAGRPPAAAAAHTEAPDVAAMELMAGLATAAQAYSWRWAALGFCYVI